MSRGWRVCRPLRAPGMGDISIRYKAMSFAVSLVLLLGLVTTLQVRNAFSRTLEREWDAHAVALGGQAAALATAPVLTNDLVGLQELVIRTCNLDQDARYLVILDATGEVLAHTFPGTVPAGLLQANSCKGDAPRVQMVDTDEGPVHDAAVPILSGRAGTVRLGLTEKRLRLVVGALTSRLLLATLLVSIAGVALVLALTDRITRRLSELGNASQAIARGDFGHRASTTSRDEIGRLSAAFNVMADSLAQGDRENARLMDALQRKEALRVRLLDQVIRAQEDERQRIARGLHDQTGQSLTSLMVSVRVLEDLVAGCDDCRIAGEIRPRLADARAVAAETLDEVHRLARGLRPAILDDLGLPSALERCAHEHARICGIPVDCRVAGLDDVRLLPQVETALYRIVQEALTNVARHAGASRIDLALERHGDAIHVIVEDDGQGFDAAAALAARDGGRLGLFGMQERAALVGGTLTVESVPGYGTTVFMQVPLAECLRGEQIEQDPAAAGG